MELESKNLNDISSFDSQLFDQVDVDIVNEKMENNISILFANQHYMDIDEELLDLKMKLNSLLGETEQKLFDKYIVMNSKSITYQNCLAYYLGLKTGISINKLE